MFFLAIDAPAAPDVEHVGRSREVGVAHQLAGCKQIGKHECGCALADQRRWKNARIFVPAQLDTREQQNPRVR